MTSNDLIAFMNRTPFSPFEIRLADGNRVHVSEPFQVATKRNSPTCTVYADDDQTHFITIRNITEIANSE